MLFIRHTAVSIDPNQPSDQWQVSENGRLLTQQLAHKITEKPDLILSSTEPKAIVTGRILAKEWHVSCQSWPNLHEHERESNEFVREREAWLNMVANFLEQPKKLVMGRETAVQSAQRLETAVRQAQAQFPQKRLAFVTHGRILTALLSQHNLALNPIQFWQNLTMPDAVWVDGNSFALLDDH